MIGRTISQYRILEKIGEGGMGEVYLAEHTTLHRRSALKFISGTAGEADIERFRREAQATAALNHPHIVTVYDVGLDEGRPFIAMEYIDGRPLSSLIASGPVPVPRAIEIALDLCSALSAAHRAGVVHRDLKPDNILIGTDGRLRILDFGLAKLRGVSRLTQKDAMLGTVAYMSPEQVRGEDVDARSDLFSLGAVLYEMLAGRAAFSGAHTTAVQYAILNASPEPLARHVPGSARLESVIEKLLEKDPSRRYASADDVAAGLRGAVAGRSVRRMPRRRILATTMLALAVALSAGAWHLLHRDRAAPAPENQPVLAVLPFENLGAPDDDYFADGITEEITSHLAMINGIGVISRTSAILYKGTNKTVREIGRELGATHILEGTVRWDPSDPQGRVRITPQLIRVADDHHIWAANYERELDAIFAVQADIAAHIARSLEVTLLEADRQSMAVPPTTSVEAYNAYLRARKVIDEGTRREDYTAARELLKRAIALDPRFAAAHAQLSILHSYAYFSGTDPTPQRLQDARRELDAAFEIDRGLPAASIAAAYYHYWGFNDYDAALASLRDAERRLPDHADIHSIAAWILRRQGHLREAESRIQRARRLDPRSLTLPEELARTYLAMGRFREAEEMCEALIATAPDYTNAYVVHAYTRLAWTGDIAGARGILNRVPRGDVESVAYARYTTDVLARDFEASVREVEDNLPAGRIDNLVFYPASLLAARCLRSMGRPDRARDSYEAARAAIEARLAENPDDHRALGALGLCYAGLGMKDEALRAGRRAVALYSSRLDHYDGYYRELELVWIEAAVGNADDAIQRLKAPLEAHRVTAPLLRIDPAYDPLRDHGGFQRLLAAASR
jgi:TolB-like protein/Tfp pilus assembly protein PilF/predicted Ser/Thr protein kinase